MSSSQQEMRHEPGIDIRWIGGRKMFLAEDTEGAEVMMNKVKKTL